MRDVTVKQVLAAEERARVGDLEQMCATCCARIARYPVLMCAVSVAIGDDERILAGVSLALELLECANPPLGIGAETEVPK